MTRKDYILIAEALNEAQPIDAETESRTELARVVWTECCAAVADALARDNPRFDYERFLKACGVQS